jgi:RNA polymerase-binding protein DksA
MSAKQLKHTFRDILDSLKDELSEDIERTVHTMQDEATVFADPNDRASQESDIALELRNRDRERKLIKKIDEAIARIEKRRIRLLRFLRRRDRPEAPGSPPDRHAVHRLQDARGACGRSRSAK